MRAIAVIPARYGSSRLPGKPLLRASGKYLVQHVWEGVQAASILSGVFIATDDERILKAAESFGAKAVMTRPDHGSGTDRVHEVVSGLSPPPDVVINVQGDEPGVGAGEVSKLVRLLEEHPEADISTLARRAGPEAGPDPARVKVVVDASWRALYFSRASIPHARGAAPEGYLVHMGMYGFRRDALERFVALPPSPLEQVEKLEQLRALEAGMSIWVGLCRRPFPSVDTPEDFRKFLETMKG